MASRRKAAHRRRLGPAFNRLWAGFALASSGDGLAYGAVPLLAVAVDPHPFAVSSVAAADSLPWLVMALPAGALADRFERGRVAAVSNLLRAALILATALVVFNGQMTLAILLFVVLANASARAFYYSAFQAIVPEIVETRDLEPANGALYATESVTEHLAGPVVGTTLFAVGRSIPFFADAFALVLSFPPFLKFHQRAKRDIGSSSSMWEGMRFLFADRGLRNVVTLVGCLSLLQGMEFGVLVLLATTEWGVREGAYGFFLATGAIGNLLGSAFASSQVRRFGSGRALLGAAVFSGVGYLLMAAAGSWQFAVPAFIVNCTAVGVGAVTSAALRQRLTPQDMLGRVGSAWRGIVWGAAPIGSLLAGALATVTSLKTPLVVAGILQCALAVILGRPLLRSVHEEHRRPVAKGRGGTGGSSTPTTPVATTSTNLDTQ